MRPVKTGGRFDPIRNPYVNTALEAAILSGSAATLHADFHACEEAHDGNPRPTTR
jgi:hypothetical protein